jgi:hypothetical protein
MLNFSKPSGYLMYLQFWLSKIPHSVQIAFKQVSYVSHKSKTDHVRKNVTFNITIVAV